MVSLTNFRIVSELSTNFNETDNQENNSRAAQNQINHPHNNKQQHSNFNDHDDDHKKYHFNQHSTNIATINNKHYALNNNILPNGHKINREHFEIRWNNLNYQVEQKWYRQKLASLKSKNNGDSQAKTKANILNNLSGSVKSGQVTAILGPSGAGKTSLLGCLTGKNKSGVSGSVQVISNRSEPMSICTIPQKGKLSLFDTLKSFFLSLSFSGHQFFQLN